MEQHPYAGKQVSWLTFPIPHRYLQEDTTRKIIVSISEHRNPCSTDWNKAGIN